MHHEPLVLINYIVQIIKKRRIYVGTNTPN